MYASDISRGIEADQKVLAAHACYATTATTALTAQNTRGVHDIHHVPPDYVGRLIDVVLDDLGADVVKVGPFYPYLSKSWEGHVLCLTPVVIKGMLASTETVGVVADKLERYGRPTAVVDPVRTVHIYLSV